MRPAALSNPSGEATRMNHASESDRIRSQVFTICCLLVTNGHRVIPTLFRCEEFVPGMCTGKLPVQVADGRRSLFSCWRSCSRRLHW